MNLEKATYSRLTAFLTSSGVITGLVAAVLCLAFLGLGWWHGASYAERSAQSYVHRTSLEFQKKLFSRNVQGGKALLPDHESLGFAAAAPEREIVLVTDGVFQPSGKTISLWLSGRLKDIEKLQRHDEKTWWINEKGETQSSIGAAQWLVYGTVLKKDKFLFVLYNLTGEKAFISSVLQLVYWFIPLLFLGVLATAWLSFRRFENDLHKISVFLSEVRHTGALEKRLEQGKSPELRQLHNQINFMLERIKRGVESLDKATTDLAHELKSPLARATTLLYGLNTDHSDKGIVRATKEMKRLSYIFEDLCQIAKMGGKPQKQRIINLSAPIEKGMKLNEAVLADRNITLTTSLDIACQISEEIMVTERIILNLFDNALKYTKRGGQISLKTEKKQKGCQLVMENSPCFAVTKEEKDLLGQKFFRAKSVTTPEGEKGYGIGLPFIKAALESVGGSCRFEVVDDVFRVILVWPDADHLWQGRKKADGGNGRGLKQGIMTGVKKIFSL